MSYSNGSNWVDYPYPYKRPKSPNRFRTRTFFKVVRADGTDLYSGTLRYLSVDRVYRKHVEIVPGLRGMKMMGGGLLYACPTLTKALEWGVRLAKDGSPVRVVELYGKPVNSDENYGKYGFHEFEVVREWLDLTEMVQKVMDENAKRWDPGSRRPSPMGETEARKLLSQTVVARVVSRDVNPTLIERILAAQS